MSNFKNIISVTLGLSFILSALFIGISVVSFNIKDPSFNHANDYEIQNYAGENGAFIADPLLQSFGLASIALVLFLITNGCDLLKARNLNLLPIRLGTLLIFLPIFAGSLAFIQKSQFKFLSSYGGFIGSYVKEEIVFHFDNRFIPYVMAILSIIGLVLISNVTVKKIIQLLKNGYFVLLYIYHCIRWLIKVAKFKLRTRHDRAELLIKSTPSFENTFEHEENEFTIDSSLDENLTQNSTIVDAPKIEIKAPKIFETKKITPMIDINQFKLPSTTLLREPLVDTKKIPINEGLLNQNSELLTQVLLDFGVNGRILCIKPGPVVTLYELEPAAGTKSSRVIGLSDDIARSMSAISARIAVISGKNALGIELPNLNREIVYLRELMESREYVNNDNKLPLVLGKNIAGEPIIADLSKMPHLLVAGTTGSGKSVAINTMVLSLLYKLSPKECQFIMIDPKMLELSVYEGIPHLLTPVVTEPKKAVIALKWVVKEMENRYRAMSTLGVRNIFGFNKAIDEARSRGEKLEKQIQTGFDKENGEPIFEYVEMPTEALPFIVVIVDEMADLMLVAGKDIEGYIQRLAQMARAAGIHIIMATQRPSVDVITGVIKANFPTRISFQVTSKIDSRTILGEQGAEQLLGMGDMLYMMGGGKIERVHGPFVGDKEVESVVAYLKTQGTPKYKEDIVIDEEEENFAFDTTSFDEGDVYKQAVTIVLKDRRPTTSYIQRCLKIGYNRAANLIERMEKEGVLSAPNHTGKREILIEEK